MKHLCAALLISTAIVGCTETNPIPPGISEGLAAGEKICKFAPTAQSLVDLMAVEFLSDPIAGAQLACKLFLAAKAALDASSQTSSSSDMGIMSPMPSHGPIVGYSFEYKGVTVQGRVTE